MNVALNKLYILRHIFSLVNIIIVKMSQSHKNTLKKYKKLSTYSQILML